MGYSILSLNDYIETHRITGNRTGFYEPVVVHCIPLIFVSLLIGNRQAVLYTNRLCVSFFTSVALVSHRIKLVMIMLR